jgi:hypothetical protein
MNDQNKPGYDQTTDPRTGRPPLAAEVERMKSERSRQPEDNETPTSTPEPSTNWDALHEDMDASMVPDQAGAPEHEIPIDDRDEDLRNDETDEEAPFGSATEPGKRGARLEEE